MSETIYKIISRSDWDFARTLGQYHGSGDDRRDGFIHFSTASQMRVTAAKHFAGQDGLVLLALAQISSANSLNGSRRVAATCFPISTVPCRSAP
jgi:uncharacterized protein (DUF952 family)